MRTRGLEGALIGHSSRAVSAVVSAEVVRDATSSDFRLLVGQRGERSSHEQPNLRCLKGWYAIGKHRADRQHVRPNAVLVQLGVTEHRLNHGH